MTKKKVIILGGGVAGMSAAHELAERGFDVHVYEQQPVYVGGKARSIDVPDSGTEKRYDLPGEHGFRFFPGFYRHITDTMKRIPFKDNKQGVFDNLVTTQRVMMARFGKPPLINIVNFPKSLDDLKVFINAMINSDTGLTAKDADFFAEKLWELMTSCYERRNSDYERIGWWEFMDADNQSEAFRQYFVGGLTRTLVAAQPKEVSSKTGGDILLQLLFLMGDPAAHPDRVLNGPTNDVWLYPWRDYLKSIGVQYHHNTIVQKINTKNRQVCSVEVKNNNANEVVTGDFYIGAVPVEVMSTLLTEELIDIDPVLGYITSLAVDTAWMTGIQYFLNEDVPMVPGHVMYTDSPWALTSISQIQFWKNFNVSDYGNGKVKGILSVDVSDWTTPGLNNKMAKDCTLEEIKDEVWAQLKKSLVMADGQCLLRDDMIVTWYLDRDIVFEKSYKTINKEPLLVNKVNTWPLRPEAYTGIPNFFLASDYVRTYTDLATMEGANEAARRAVNAIIETSDTKKPLCEIWKLHEPDVLDVYRWHDKKRFDKGLPWQKEKPLIIQLLHYINYFILKIFPTNSSDKKRTLFVIYVMIISILVLIVDSLLKEGWVSAAVWSYGFSAVFLGYALLTRDKILLRFFLFVVTAGFAELIADKWLVDYTQTLIYPHLEPMLLSSPAYMPFSWTVVLMEVGYIGWLFSPRWGLIKASLFLCAFGAVLVPLYETWAIDAGWWYYHNTPTIFGVPQYVILAEGLLMLTVPYILSKVQKAKPLSIIGWGLVEGIVMLLACFVAYFLLGK